MEPNSDADEPYPPTPPEIEDELDEETPLDEPAETPADETDPAQSAPAESDELAVLAEAAAKARLSPLDEERLTVALKSALLGGRAGVARAVEALAKVPWIVGVRAVEQAWPELTAGFRTQLLSGLGKDETDGARRMRLSLARALFKIDVAVALKVALGTLKDMRDKETGALTPKNLQVISNVFIGRGKPWLAQLPLAELKPGEIDLLVHCAVLAVFSMPHPPVTQLGALKWAKDADRLDKLQEPVLEAVRAGVGRWSVKWQNALRKEVSDLPEAITAVLRPAPALDERQAPPAEGEPEEEPAAEGTDTESEGEEGEAQKRERPVYEPRPQRPREAAAETRGDRGDRGDRDSQKERPVYTPRNATAGAASESRGGRGSGSFNLNEALKGIDAHVQSLRSELAQAQTKLRQKEDRPRRGEKIGPIIEGEPTPEELARLNLQLEARNEELQARIDELMQNSEDLAASVGAMSGEPVNDAGAQLRTLLAYKLGEDFADFLALEQESHDLVVQQHYRTIIRHVFEVLREVQIPLQVPTPESAPQP